MERRRPDADRLSTHLQHPPFTFQLKRFEAGTLRGDRVHRRQRPSPGTGAHARVRGAPHLRLDESGRPFAARGKDVAFLHAELRDVDETLVARAWENVFFGAAGDVRLTGANPFSSEAGVASILVTTEVRLPRGEVYALCLARDGERVRVLSAALPFNQDPRPYEVRITTDGSDPAGGAVHRAGPVVGAGRVRAALFVAGERLVEADTDVPKFRIAGSTAPE